jgi:hypothetical protein
MFAITPLHMEPTRQPAIVLEQVPPAAARAAPPCYGLEKSGFRHGFRRVSGVAQR